MSGIWSTGNSTSTTGPITRDTRPTPPAGASDFLSSTVAVMARPSLLGGGGGFGQSTRSADDLGNLLGDFCLPGLISFPSQAFDQLLGVVRGRLHRLLPTGEFRCRGLQEA